MGGRTCHSEGPCPTLTLLHYGSPLNDPDQQVRAPPQCLLVASVPRPHPTATPPLEPRACPTPSPRLLLPHTWLPEQLCLESTPSVWAGLSKPLKAFCSSPMRPWCGHGTGLRSLWVSFPKAVTRVQSPLHQPSLPSSMPTLCCLPTELLDPTP